MIRTKLNKEQFIENINKRIEARKTILDFYENVYLPTLCLNFDGKVYNKRFINALREQASKISDCMHITERENNTIQIQMRIDRYNYNDCEVLYCKCITNNEGRLDYNKTITDEFGKSWLANFKETITEYQMTIDNYDLYMKTTQRIDDAINDYKELPFAFRQNVEVTNKFYL